MKMILEIMKTSNCHSGLHVFCVIPGSTKESDTGIAKNTNRYDNINPKTKLVPMFF